MDEIVKVLIVDDHKIFRAGLELILNGFTNVKVVGQVENQSQLFNVLKSNLVDLIFMDIKMPETDGIELTRLVLKKHPEVRIIGLSMYGEIEYLNKMLEAGASGFMLKNTQETELEEAIQCVMAGDYYLAKEFRDSIEQKYLTRQKSRIILSDREQEVLQLIAQGLSNQEIGERLNISVHTVDGHRRNLINKTGVKNSANLVLYAVKNGLLEF